MTYSPCRLCTGFALALSLLTLRLDAAPGQLTTTGPFVMLGKETSIASVKQLVYPSSDPLWILARSTHDLFETRDAGVNWRSVLPFGTLFSPLELVVDATNPEHFFLFGFQPDGRQVIETRDRGRSWSPLYLPDPLTPAGEPTYLESFFVDPHDPRTMAIERFGFFSGNHYLVSRDAGQSWSQIFLPPGSTPFLFTELLGVDRGVVWFQGGKLDLNSGVFTGLPARELQFADWLAFDLVRSDTVFTGSGRYYFAKSTDGGNSFLRPYGGGYRAFSQSPANPSHLATVFNTLVLSLDRGSTWVSQGPSLDNQYVEETAFDPVSGELILTKSALDPVRFEFARRTLDGTFVSMATNGFYPAGVESVWAQGDKSLAISRGRLYFRDAEGLWQPRGLVGITDPYGNFDGCGFAPTIQLSPSDPNNVVVACGNNGVFITRDGGLTWRRPIERFFPNSFDVKPTLGLAKGSGGPVLYFHYLEEPGANLYRSLDFGETWEIVGENLLSVVVHPDTARGVVAIHFDGSLRRYLPATGWHTIPTTTSFGSDPAVLGGAALGNVAAYPELIYAVVRGSFLRSLDFGETWEQISTYSTAFEDLYGHPPSSNPVFYVSSIVIDPFDANHWLLPFHSFETHDGGITFGRAPRTTNRALAFDPLTPGHVLAGTDDRGVLEMTSTLSACPETGKAWCAHEGRFQLTVDWKDPQGQRGRATRVVSGSEDSGLFYFFDANNWELLVKVLDGCGLNQRFWLLAAGTTDVEYVLQVEDRWTGQIRHYANAAGQAAPAVVDTDAFSGCGVAPPPGAAPAATASASLPKAAGGDTTLSLLGGKFEAKASWTDFSGGHGEAFTAPLRSESSGLFYFFSPNNWEMLLKVLDGCAINGHYWVLAAATTDVGYDLEISEPGGLGRKKTYNNPVGRTAPALIDLEAFSCPSP